MNANLITIIFALALPLTAVANPGECKGDHEHFQAKKIERMDKALSLTDDQKSRLEALFKQNGEKFKALHEETQSQLKTILTPEQYTRLQEMKQRRHEQWREKRQKKQHEHDHKKSDATQS